MHVCSGDCLKECVLKHLDVAKAGARESDLSLTYARKSTQGSCVRQVYVQLTLDPLRDCVGTSKQSILTYLVSYPCSGINDEEGRV